MRLARALEDKKYDVRLLDKLVADKKLSYKDVEDYKIALKDDASLATTTQEIAQKKERS